MFDVQSSEMATIVYNVPNNGAGLRGTLFEGLTFWLSQRVPQRSRFVAEIEVCESLLNNLTVAR